MMTPLSFEPDVWVAFGFVMDWRSL